MSTNEGRMLMLHSSRLGKRVHLKLRRLEEADYDRKFMDLLSQLTVVGTVSKRLFLARLEQMRRMDGMYHVVVLEDVKTGMIVGAATLVIELKFIRNLGKCGHIEDVVVNEAYRGLSAGLHLIHELEAIARDQGCYKLILDCSADNVPFYERCGLKRKEVQMVKYLEASNNPASLDIVSSAKL